MAKSRAHHAADGLRRRRHLFSHRRWANYLQNLSLFAVMNNHFRLFTAGLMCLFNNQADEEYLSATA